MKKRERLATIRELSRLRREEIKHHLDWLRNLRREENYVVRLILTEEATLSPGIWTLTRVRKTELDLDWSVTPDDAHGQALMSLLKDERDHTSFVLLETADRPQATLYRDADQFTLRTYIHAVQDLLTHYNLHLNIDPALEEEYPDLAVARSLRNALAPLGFAMHVDAEAHRLRRGTDPTPDNQDPGKEDHPNP